MLASASPRRAELLRVAGFDFDVVASAADETVWPAEAPERYVRRVAEAKARAVRERVGDRLVLAADTTVVVDERILGKPVDLTDARRMLQLLAGRTHSVLTAVCWLASEADIRVARTTVDVAPLSVDEIDWYVRSGEPMDKAGAYAIQGLASRFIRRIEGSYSNVVGLPLALVHEMVRSACASGPQAAPPAS